MKTSMEELVAAVNAVEEKKSRKTLYTVLAIIGGLVVIGAIAYAVYRLLTPEYLEDFEEDLDDEFDDEFFDDLEDEEESTEETVEETVEE